MVNLLLIESEENIKQLLTNAIKNELRATITFVRDAREAIAHIKVNKYDLVVTREQIRQQRAGGSMVNFKKKEPKCPSLLILGDEEFICEGVRNLPIPYDHADLTSIIHIMLTEAKLRPEKENLSPYLEFNLVFFKSMDKTPVDLYLKMIKSDGLHFVKRYRAGDLIDQDVIEKYEQSEKINNMYIQSKDRFAFFNNIVQICFEYICRAKSKEIHLDIGRHSENYQIIQSMVNTFGIDDETIRLCDQTIKKMMGNIRTYKHLNDLLRGVLNSPGSYNFKHAYMTLLFTAHIFPHMKMSGEKHYELVIEKMGYVCFFHDICLQDEKLIKISNKIQFYKADLTHKERELVDKHANMAATLLQKYTGLPSGVHAIIKQHHGTTNGIGFTDYYKADISQLAILFIILEEFVGQVLSYDEHKNGVVQIIETMARQYELPSYIKIVNALMDSVKSPVSKKNKRIKKKVA